MAEQGRGKAMAGADRRTDKDAPHRSADLKTPDGARASDLGRHPALER